MPSFGDLSRGKLRFFAVFLDFLPSYLSLNFVNGFSIIETEVIFVKLTISRRESGVGSFRLCCPLFFVLTYVL